MSSVRLRFICSCLVFAGIFLVLLLGFGAGQRSLAQETARRSSGLAAFPDEHGSSTDLQWSARENTSFAIVSPNRWRDAVAASTMTFTPTADARISESADTQNFGSETQLAVKHSASGLDLSLIRFDISALPPGVVIQRAVMRVFATDKTGPLDPIPVSVRLVTSSWDEGSVTWNTKPTVASVITTVDTSGHEWVTWDVLAQVRDWYAGHRNYGLQLGGPATSQYALYISSREGPHPPELVVAFESAATPTPSPTRPMPPTATRTPTTTTPPYFELGDAPDSSNSSSLPMTAYPGVPADFPTAFFAGSPPYGPRHAGQTLQFFLGARVSLEFEADYGQDQDLTPNINPFADLADLDGADDGLALPASFSHCQLTTLVFTVTALADAPRQVYVNLWCDWNRNGRWGETPPCPGATAPEWAVQNQAIDLPGPGTYITRTNAFLPYNPDADQAMWLRITVAEVAAPPQSANGSGPPIGYKGGETEDYVLRGLPAPTSTPTPTERPSLTPPLTRTHTATATGSATPSATPTLRPTLTQPLSPTPTATGTTLVTGTPPAAPTETPTLQPSPTRPPTRTSTPTPTLQVTHTPALTPTVTPTRPNLPDLIVTDMWLQDNHICYQLMNSGAALAPPGHHTLLSMDGVVLAEDPIDVDLPAGQRLRRCFEPAWRCVPHGALTVCADHQSVVAEIDETNNCRQEAWRCDAAPPRIVFGPTVSRVTQDSALISWETDEESDSMVKYGKRAGNYAFEQTDAHPVKNHQVALTGLDPSAVYHFMVASTDSSGNTASSADGMFTTLAAPDERDPDISIADPGLCRGTVVIPAQASDDKGVHKVVFSIDGAPVSTDYSPPYELALDTTGWPNGGHTLTAVAYDLFGRTTSAEQIITFTNLLPDLLNPVVWIVSPADGTTVEHGTVEITAHAHDESPNYVGSGPVARVDFYIDDQYCWSATTATSPFTYVYPWNTVIKPPGSHQLKAIAYDDAGNSATDVITITVPSPTPVLLRPWLEVTRLPLSRDGTSYRTGLRLENVGSVTARNIEIRDRSSGFQPRRSDDGPLTGSFSYYFKTYTVILGGALDLDPGESEELWYRLVPFMTEDQVSYEIGSSTSLAYQGAYNMAYTQEFSIPEPDDLDVGDVFESAVFLIVTHPQRLFGCYKDSDVNELLLTTGRLAGDRNGVLGYLDTYSSSTLEDLVSANGDWGSQLFAHWGSTGYLLLVGETEIVPSVTVYDTEIRDGIEDWGDDVYPVTGVDNWYADTTGGDQRPELVVGRIIGNDALSLMVPIETSLRRQFECERVLLVSGVGDNEDEFYDNIEDIHLDFAFKFDNIAVIHGVDYGSDQARTKAVLGKTRDRDVILFQGHGSASGWGQTLYTYDFPLDFGDSYPVVFGSACSNGAYAGTYSIAEAFLDSEAGVFIGATEVSPIGTNCEALLKFSEEWVTAGAHSTSGTALKQTKRKLIAQDPDSIFKRLWVMEYNLYGDPRYAVCEATAGSLPDELAAAVSPKGQRDATAAVEPVSSLDVTVPDYQVTTSHGFDRVHIPGGALLLEPDKPVVPFWVVSLEYPAGYAVRDVVLTERPGLTSTTGLNLPLGNMAIASSSTSETAKAVTASPKGWRDRVAAAGPWYPEEDYGWSTYENPDGSTTLVIRMYPFYYNALTTDAQFYQSYHFAISYTVSTVGITHVATGKDVYEPGEAVTVDIELSNSGDTQGVVVSALIKSYGSGQVVDGLLLQQLNGLLGDATFSPHWDSGGTAPGAYCVEVTLSDLSGNILDRKTARFMLGASSAEVVNLTATPDPFDVGTPISVHMVLSNTGSLPISGSAIIRVEEETGAALQEFTHEFTVVAPGQSVPFDDIWDTLGAKEGSYRIVGYALYDSQASSPVSITVNTTPKWRVYLPVVLRGSR